MKKLNFVALAILVLGIFVFTGCSDEGSMVNPVDSQKLNNITGKASLSLGELHNEGLSYIYDDVITNLTNESLVEINHMTSISSWEYSNLVYGSEIAKYHEVMFNIHSDNYHGIDNTSYFSPELMAEINILIEYVESAITETNINAGNEIFNYSKELLNNNPPSNLQGYEIEAWKSAVDVMGYSAIYWFSNIEAW